MFTSKDDFVVQMPPIKTENIFNFEQPTSVSSAQEFSVKSESNMSFEYDTSKSDDRSKYGSEFITPESTNGKFLNLVADNPNVKTSFSVAFFYYSQKT